MDRPRFGEKLPLYHRKQRYFKRQGLWYYRTREGKLIGPYDRLTDAIFGCGNYIKYLRQSPALAELMLSGEKLIEN